MKGPQFGSVWTPVSYTELEESLCFQSNIIADLSYCEVTKVGVNYILYIYIYILYISWFFFKHCALVFGHVVDPFRFVAMS